MGGSGGEGAGEPRGFVGRFSEYRVYSSEVKERALFFNSFFVARKNDRKGREGVLIKSTSWKVVSEAWYIIRIRD